MWLEAVPESASDACKCPTCGSGVRRREYGEMHAGSYVQDGIRVDIRREPNAGFIDPVSLDPLTQYFNGGLYRIYPSDRYYSRGGKKLHRDVWRSAFGDIPARCHIHHRDSIPSNNALANLECLDSTEHLSLTWHAQERDQHFTQNARDKAADWHGSEAGRLWHKQHAEKHKAWTKWKREPMPCQHCAKTFDGLVRAGNPQRYCSDSCKVAAYRARGADARATARYRERQKAQRDI